MTSRAINSGAINAVSFPMAEEGASLIELIGTIRVTATMSALALIVNAPGGTQAMAETSTPDTRIAIQMAATTQSMASGLASTTKLIMVAPSPGAASASCLASAGIRASLSATQSAEAVTYDIDARTRSGQEALGSAVAQCSATAIRLISVSGSTEGYALPSVDAFPYAARSASVNATAETSAVGYLVARVGSDSVATASAEAAATIKSITGGYASMQVNSSVDAVIKFGVAAQGSAAAACGEALTGLARPITCETTARASALDATPNIKFSVAASTSAYAEASATAIDAASTIRAPEDRQMVVQQSPRHMEVTI